MEAEDLAAEYETLVLPRFDEWAALTLGFGLVETARAAGAPVVIDIRTADRVLFHVALPGATPLNRPAFVVTLPAAMPATCVPCP